MDALLIYLLEVSVCLGISLMIYRILLSGLTFFSWNRSILLGLLLLSGIIPTLRFELFGIGTEVSEMTLPVFQVGEQVKPSGEQWLSWSQLILWIYATGVVLMAARLIFGFMASQKLIGQAKLARFNGFWVAVHPDFVPASFFDYILMPDFDPEDIQQRQILAHESVHVRLRHSWDLLLVNLAKVIFWFNPLIYLFEKSLREVHEYQADQGVTEKMSRKEYATLLLQLVTAKPGFQFMNNFNQFQTKKRIQMMAKAASEPLQRFRFLGMVPLVGLLVFVFSCENEDIPIQLSLADPAVNQVSMINPRDEAPDVPKEQPGNEPVILDSPTGEDVVFDVVEEQPKPEGGLEGWNEYLAKNIRYPSQARKMGIEGTVIVVFEVQKDGSVNNAEILRGIGGGADEEAIRVVLNSPKWEPGRQRGRAVTTRLRLPIRFKLASNKSVASGLRDKLNTDVKPQLIVVGYDSPLGN